MNKKLIAVAIAGAFAGASPAVMAGAPLETGVSGFVDSIFTFSDERFDDAGLDVDGAAANTKNTKFETSGEVDFMGSMGNVAVRIDLDVNGGTTVEQSKISWMANDAVTVNIGRQNAVGLGFEGEDAPDLYQTTTGQIRDIINGQSTVNAGNNVEGVIFDFGAGPANISVGLLNDLQGANESNSLLITAGGSPMDGLDLQLGIVTQADNTALNTASLENLIDIYATYGMDNWWVNFEFLSAGTDADSMVDTGMGLTGHMDFGNGFGATLRFDTVAYNDTGAVSNDDSTSTTLAGTYAAADNLGFVLEFRTDDDGTTDTSRVTLEAVGTFGK